VIPNLVSIHAIPREFIQCEGDTFVSPRRYQTTASVAVVVEKKSKLILGKRIPSLKPRVMARTIKIFSQRMHIGNIVMDRGIENRYHERFGVPAYFCDPQSPHQKPLAEGSIGLIRRWFWKKGTNLAEVSNQEIQKNINILNNKYRKSLDYMSALEVARGCGILKGETKAESCT
jgi:IS30 family transposase